MKEYESTIEIQAPVSEVYNQWTQFEEFPRFMDDVEEVQQKDDTHLTWKANIAGKEKEWDAEIVEQTPDKIIQWKSVTGAPNTGLVTFESLDPNCTRVSLKMSVEPEGLLESAGAAVGIFGSRVENDLENFKDLMESNSPVKESSSDSAWRGEVHDGAVKDSANDKMNNPVIY